MFSKDLKPFTISSEIWSLTTDNQGNLYIETRTESWQGNVYRCLATISEFQPMFGIKDEVWALAVDKQG